MAPNLFDTVDPWTDQVQQAQLDGGDLHSHTVHVSATVQLHLNLNRLGLCSPGPASPASVAVATMPSGSLRSVW